jgi:hypothetical protein
VHQNHKCAAVAVTKSNGSTDELHVLISFNKNISKPVDSQLNLDHLRSKTFADAEEPGMRLSIVASALNMNLNPTSALITTEELLYLYLIFNQDFLHSVTSLRRPQKTEKSGQQQQHSKRNLQIHKNDAKNKILLNCLDKFSEKIWNSDIDNKLQLLNNDCVTDFLSSYKKLVQSLTIASSADMGESYSFVLNDILRPYHDIQKLLSTLRSKKIFRISPRVLNGNCEVMTLSTRQRVRLTDGLHAEMKTLEYILLENGISCKLDWCYIGISMLCCAYCAYCLRQYNIGHRGNHANHTQMHETYKDWVCPNLLTHEKLVIDEEKTFVEKQQSLPGFKRRSYYELDKYRRISECCDVEEDTDVHKEARLSYQSALSTAEGTQ